MTSKKLYIAIAKEIRPLVESVESDGERETLLAVVGRLAGVFQADNPNFNRVTFFKACGTWNE